MGKGRYGLAESTDLFDGHLHRDALFGMPAAVHDVVVFSLVHVCEISTRVAPLRVRLASGKDGVSDCQILCPYCFFDRCLGDIA